MFVKLISLLTILITLCAPVLEAHEQIYSNEIFKTESISQEAQITKSITSIKSTNCEHCQDDGCTDEDSCCQSFCACISLSYMRSSKSANLLTSIPLLTKSNWYFFNNYLSPSLDPALKPPLFS